MTSDTRARLLRLQAERTAAEEVARKSAGRLRSALVLARADGASVAELAELLGVSRQAAHKLVTRG